MPPSQALNALTLGNERRLAIAALRHQVRRNEISVKEILIDPPAAMDNLSLFEVMMLGRAPRDKSSAAVRHRIGQAAVRDRINVLIAIGDASERTLRWAADNAPTKARKTSSTTEGSA